MNNQQPSGNGRCPHDPMKHYRLYIDESGDHVYKRLDEANHRYLCLLGCFFVGSEYHKFHLSLDAFKHKHIPHSPDDPVVLHREDILNRRGSFWRLRDPAADKAFGDDLIGLLDAADFRIVAVVIDKKTLWEKFGEAAAHPYNLGLGFMLQRYCGYLNRISRRGDVMAESRGTKEDMKLKESYQWVYNRGAWVREARFFQQALTSQELKVKPKTANIPGLQLADLLGHPVKQAVLREKGMLDDQPTQFAKTLLGVAERKFNRHFTDGRVWGYGKVLYPQ